MALYMKQNEQRSELQDRIAAELQEKAKRNSQLQDRPDGVDDAAYMKNTKQTTSLAWVWLLIGIAIVALVIWLLITTA